MKKIKFLTLLILSHCVAFFSYGQTDAISQVKTAKNIDWHFLSPFGQYFLYTNGALSNINPETGETVWEASFPLLYKSLFKRLADSPFYIVESSESFQILDPYSGKVILSLNALPIQTIEEYRYFSKTNHILISGIDKEQKNQMLFVSMDSGETIWSNPNSEALIDAFLLENGDIVFSTTEKIQRIDPKSGNQLWETEIVPEDKPLEIAGFKLVGGSRKPNVGQYNFIKHPTKSIAYAGLELQKSQPTPSDPNAVSYSTNYYAFDLNNGSHLWKQPLTGGGRLTPLLFLEEGLISPTTSNIGFKINLFAYGSEQAGQWGNKQNGIKIKGYLTDFGHVEAGTIVFSQYRPGSGSLYFIDQKTKMPADEEIKVDGDLHAVKDVGNNNILVLTSEAAYVLNIANGKFEMNKSIPTSPALVAEDGDKIFIYDKKDNLVKTVNTKTGSVDEFSKKIKLNTKENLTQLKFLKEGISVSSLQEFILFGLDGEVKYHKYFEAPKKSDVTEALAEARHVSNNYARVLEPGLIGNFEDAFTSELKEVDNQSTLSDYGKKHVQATQKRLNMIKDQPFTYAIAAGESNTLVKVNLATGEQVNSISLGTEKRPEYLFDAVSGYLYLMADDKTVNVFKP